MSNIAYTMDARATAMKIWAKEAGTPEGQINLAKHWKETLESNLPIFIGQRAVALAGLDWLAGRNNAHDKAVPAELRK